MNRTTFSLSVFGERAALLEYSSGGSNERYIGYLKTQLKKAMDEVLTPAQRKAVEEYYFENKTLEEIATLEGVNRSTICRNLHRGLKRLSLSLRFCEPYQCDEQYII